MLKEIEELVEYMKKEREQLGILRGETVELRDHTNKIDDKNSAFYKNAEIAFQDKQLQYEKHTRLVISNIKFRKELIEQKALKTAKEIDSLNSQLTSKYAEIKSNRESLDGAKSHLRWIESTLHQKYGEEENEFVKNARNNVKRLEDSIPTLTSEIKEIQARLAELIPEGKTPQEFYLELQESMKIVKKLSLENLDENQKKLEDLSPSKDDGKKDDGKKDDGKKDDGKKDDGKKDDGKKDDGKKDDGKKDDGKKDDGKKDDGKKDDGKKDDGKKDSSKFNYIFIKVGRHKEDAEEPIYGTSYKTYEGESKLFLGQKIKESLIIEFGAEETAKKIEETKKNYNLQQGDRWVISAILEAKIDENDRTQLLTDYSKMLKGEKVNGSKLNLVYDIKGLRKSELSKEERKDLIKHAKQADDLKIASVEARWTTKLKWKLQDVSKNLKESRFGKKIKNLLSGRETPEQLGEGEQDTNEQENKRKPYELTPEEKRKLQEGQEKLAEKYKKEGKEQEQEVNEQDGGDINQEINESEEIEQNQ